MRMPCCLYAGEWDPMFAEIKKGKRIDPTCKILLAARRQSPPTFIRSDLVLPRVIEFLGKRDR